MRVGITEQLGIASTSLSFHLKELVNAALVSQERTGRNLIYRARIDAMNDLIGFLIANCCSGRLCMPNPAFDCSDR